MMEAIRPDEGPVLKTGGGGRPLVSSSLTASAFGLIVQQEDAGSALWSDQRFASVPGAILGESTLLDGPVVQRQRLLAYTQATMVQLHPGLLSPRYANR